MAPYSHWAFSSRASCLLYPRVFALAFLTPSNVLSSALPKTSLSLTPQATAQRSLLQGGHSVPLLEDLPVPHTSEGVLYFTTVFFFEARYEQP